MEGIALVLALAVVGEALVEYGSSIFKAFHAGEWKCAVKQICAVVLSVLVCFAASANLFEVLGILFFAPWVGVALTGVLASRGANFVSDIISKFKK